MRRALFSAGLLGTALLLTACAEKPQELTGTRIDKPAHAGTGVSAFTEAGWKAGDPASWSNHLKARANYGMNDHARAPK
jgi:starvation-inducible outer membrane lipoprotein